MTREEAKIAAVRLMDEAMRPEGVDDEGWYLFTTYVLAYDPDKLADDLLVGLTNGYSIEFQSAAAKKALTSYREHIKSLFDEADEFKKSIQKNA